MKIDQKTINAVNAWLDKHVTPFTEGPNNRIHMCDLDADDVSTLLLALAKCEPVLSLVEAARRSKRAYDEGWRVDMMDHPPVNDLAAALAPFCEGTM